jgi:toxin ParE1/3/4
MTFSVRFTREARKDLKEIYAYIAENVSQKNAESVIRGILRTALTLQEMPQKGAHPPELLAVGERSHRQLVFKAYRIFYRVRDKTVYVGLIADGRRNLLPLLSRRLGGSR